MGRYHLGMYFVIQFHYWCLDICSLKEDWQKCSTDYHGTANMEIHWNKAPSYCLGWDNIQNVCSLRDIAGVPHKHMQLGGW